MEERRNASDQTWRIRADSRQLGLKAVRNRCRSLAMADDGFGMIDRRACSGNARPRSRSAIADQSSPLVNEEIPFWTGSESDFRLTVSLQQPRGWLGSRRGGEATDSGARLPVPQSRPTSARSRDRRVPRIPFQIPGFRFQSSTLGFKDPESKLRASGPHGGFGHRIDKGRHRHPNVNTRTAMLGFGAPPAFPIHPQRLVRSIKR